LNVKSKRPKFVIVYVLAKTENQESSFRGFGLDGCWVCAVLGRRQARGKHKCSCPVMLSGGGTTEGSDAEVETSRTRRPSPCSIREFSRENALMRHSTLRRFRGPSTPRPCPMVRKKFSRRFAQDADLITSICFCFCVASFDLQQQTDNEGTTYEEIFWQLLDCSSSAGFSFAERPGYDFRFPHFRDNLLKVRQSQPSVTLTGFLLN